MEIKGILDFYMELEKARVFAEVISGGFMSVDVKHNERNREIPDESSVAFGRFLERWDWWSTFSLELSRTIDGAFDFFSNCLDQPLGIYMPTEVEREILFIMRRTDERYAAKLLARALNLEKTMREKERS